MPWTKQAGGSTHPWRSHRENRNLTTRLPVGFEPSWLRRRIPPWHHTCLSTSERRCLCGVATSPRRWQAADERSHSRRLDTWHSRRQPRPETRRCWRADRPLTHTEALIPTAVTPRCASWPSAGVLHQVHATRLTDPAEALAHLRLAMVTGDPRSCRAARRRARPRPTTNRRRVSWVARCRGSGGRRRGIPR